MQGRRNQKTPALFPCFAFPGLESNSFCRGGNCKGAAQNSAFPCVRSLKAQVSLDSIKVNKLAFPTKARLSFGIYRHRILQSCRQAQVGAGQTHGRETQPRLLGAATRMLLLLGKSLNQKVKEQNVFDSALFLVCAI